MEKFIVGKSYKVNSRDHKVITITKRTKCYIEFTGDYCGKKMINDFNLFGMGEHILIVDYLKPNYPISENEKGIKVKYFCFAEKIVDPD